MTEQQRVRIGIAGIGAGSALLIIGVLIAHFTGLAETDSVGREIYPHIPRCLPWEDNPVKCWMLPTGGQAIGFFGSQLLLAGIVFGWIVGRPLTWARASIAAFLFTVEALLVFGVVPNQWLGLAQSTFEWTEQKIAFTLPTWLTLSNEVSISYGAIKDIVAGGYAAIMLGLIAVSAYQLQERAKRKDQPPPPRISAYGRPMVKGGR